MKYLKLFSSLFLLPIIISASSIHDNIVMVYKETKLGQDQILTIEKFSNNSFKVNQKISLPKWENTNETFDISPYCLLVYGTNEQLGKNLAHKNGMELQQQLNRINLASQVESKRSKMPDHSPNDIPNNPSNPIPTNSMQKNNQRWWCCCLK